MSVKAYLRDALAEILFAIGASSPARQCRGKLLILTFHRVLPAALRSEYPLPGLAVTPEELCWILSALQDHFETHLVSDAVTRLRSGSERPLLAVSFDDGQWDNLEFAAPVLKTLGVPATFYLPTDFIERTALLWHDRAAFAWQGLSVEQRERALQGTIAAGRLDSRADVPSFLEAMKHLEPQRRADFVEKAVSLFGTAVPAWARLMTWREVLELTALGHEIGSHSCSHALLPQLSDADQARELQTSMKVLSDQLGTKVRSLCYPNGSYDERSIELARAAGYENAVTTRWGINAPTQPAFELLRCDMDARRLLNRHGTPSRARLAMRLAGLQPGLTGRADVRAPAGTSAHY